MTDEEINKNFEVVAGHLAALAVGLDTLRELVGKVSDKVERTADGMSALLGIAEIQSAEIKDLAESVAAVRDSVKAVDQRQREADERARNIDERLNVLIGVVEKLISDRNGKGGG